MEHERAKQEQERHLEGPDRVTVDMMDSTDVPIERSVIRQWYKSAKFVSTTVHYTVQCNKQCHMKVLLNSFHLNGHTLGFHPET